MPASYRRAALLVAVFLLSGSMLAFQVLQVVVLSLQLFPEAAFLVVSLSMLGLGCGGSLAMVLTRREDPERRLPALASSAVAFAVAIVGAMVVTSHLHGLVGLIVVSAVPHVFAGLFLALLFAARREAATAIYCADLLGAGCGCAAIVWLLDHLADAGAVAIVLGAVTGLAAGIVAALFAPRRVGLAAFVVAGTLLLLPRTETLFFFGPAPEKFYGQLLAKGAEGGRVVRRAWNFLGRVDAFEPGPAIVEYDFAKRAAELTQAGCVFRLLFSNGYNWSYTVDFAGHAEDLRPIFDRWVQRVPYLFTTAPDVLNVGSGGGVDVYLAILNGARSATAVEINGLMIEATTGWYPHDWGDLWQRPEVTVREMDARTFVNTTDRRFDVVSLNAVDTAGTQASLLSVNFLYTREAFGRYLDVLRPGGVIFLTRPREQLLRAITAAVAALRARGTSDVGRHVVVLGVDELLSAAIYTDPLTDTQVGVLQDRVRAGDFGGAMQWGPGAAVEANVFRDYFAAVESDREVEFARSAGLRTDPATDDRPYFYQVEPSFLSSAAARLLKLILIVVAGAGGILVFAPLLRLELPDKNRRLVGHLAYFGCLGLGFMLVEIALMQQLSLILGHPAYSVSVTLAGMLVCCGVGSLVAGRLARRRRSSPITCALAASAVAIALYAVLVPWLTALAPASLAGRVALCLALLAPGSLCMGMPFPLKLQSLDGADRVLVPWAWAVNGLASVAGSVVAVALTMSFGFRVVLLLASGLYVVALLVERAMTHTARKACAVRAVDAVVVGEGSGLSRPCR